MLISAAAVVTGDVVLRPGWIETADERIVAIGDGAPAGPAGTDFGTGIVVPGFVDMHVHGGGGATFGQKGGQGESVADVVRTATRFHRSHGTTSMMASLVSAHPDDLLAQVAELAGPVHDGQLLGIHLEGPWLAPERCGAHQPSALRNPDLNEIRKVFRAGDGAVRMVTLAPELPGALEAIRFIVDTGAVAAIGHTDASYEQIRPAIDAGATVATHLFNAMRPVHHRHPGPAVALIADDGVLVEMIADGLHLHPAVFRDVCLRAGPDRVAVITDAIGAAGMPDGPYRLGALEVTVQDGVATVAGADTIAGSTATMDASFRFSMRHNGSGGEDALLGAVRHTSINPARALGLPARGLLTGVTADLVVLDADWQVSAVMQRGRWVG